jgi:hypothetical protein
MMPVRLIALAWAAFLGPLGEKLSIEHFAERGGMSRAMLSSKAEGAVRVLVGGSIGAGSLEQEAFLADLFGSSGLDAIAVGYEDLSARGPDRRNLLSSKTLPFVCANVKGVGQTHVVRTVAGTRVALVGVTKVPAYVKGFETAPGWTIEEPAAVLKALLPELKRAADVVVLLAVMDRLECAQLVGGVSGVDVALMPAVAGNDPEPVQVGTAQLVQSTSLATTVSRLTLAVDAKKVTGITNRVETVELSEADQGRMKALFSKHPAERLDLERLLSGVAAAPSSAPVKETGPLVSLLPGAPQAVVVARSDGSVEIRTESVRVASEVGGRKAPPGSSWLIVESVWKNLIPLVRSGGTAVPTTYSVANAGDNLYVVANGKTLGRLDAELSAGSGGLLEGRSISLKSFGTTRRGALVFGIPSSGVSTLELEFYDFRHAPMIFPLLVRPSAVPGGDEKPIGPTLKNEILEVGVFGLKMQRIGTEPEGMRTVRVDLRARSLGSVESGGIRITTAGDIQDAWTGLRLVTEGDREFAPEKNSALPETPRFLPEVMTGVDVLFVIPEKAAPLALRWTFPDIGMPDGRVVKPAPLRISLGGKSAAGQSCPKCGEQAGLNDKFCARCGTKLGK